MKELLSMKELLISSIQGQLTHLETVDTKELGEAIDMVKDLSEAIYYCTITEAMTEKEKHKEHYTRDMDKDKGRMYYDMPSVWYEGDQRKPYKELEYGMMRDGREGRSPISRRMYMEAKEMHQPKETKIKELEKYLQELSSDITEMIVDATPEEKQVLEKKLSGLVTKIGNA